MNGPQFAVQSIVQGTAAVVSAVFVDQDGEPRTPGTVTVHITRSDGTDVLAAGTTTSRVVAEGSPTLITVALTPAQTSQLDLLSCVWTEANGAQVATIVDVRGGRYFSIYEARLIDPELRRTEKFSDQDIKRVRVEVEREVDRITGRSFVPRFAHDTAEGAGVRVNNPLRLAQTDVRSVRWVKVGGTNYASMNWELTGSRLSFGNGVGLASNQIANGPSYRGDLPVLVEAGYEYGWNAPPEDLKRAMVTRLRSRLINGSTQIDPRATAVTTDGSTFSLSTPGQRGAKTGIPDVDEVYGEYTRPDWKEDFVGSMRIV